MANFRVDRAPLHVPFSARVTPIDGQTVVAIEGEMDLDTRDRAEAALLAVEATNPKGIVIDLTRVTFLASVGINLLLDSSRRARAAGIGFAVIPGGAERVIDVCGLREEFALRGPLTATTLALAP